MATANPVRAEYFRDHMGITARTLERCLGEALIAGGDFAELYFESVASTSIGIDEGIVKSASQGYSVGCGIRVLCGERTGFSYTDDLSAERLLKAARTAALIASGPAKTTVQPFVETEAPVLYPVAGIDADIAAKLALVTRADKAARAYDHRITQVRAGYSDEVRRILIVASDGTYASDTQPLSRLSISVLAKDANGQSARGSGGGGAALRLRTSTQRNRPSTLHARRRGRQSCNSMQFLPPLARWK